MSKYKEIFKLKALLKKANIKYEFIDRSLKDKELIKKIGFNFEHYQICCPNSKDRYISVIERIWNLR